MACAAATAAATVLCIGMGNIGNAAIQHLRDTPGLKVMTASRNRGDVHVDISSKDSILSLDQQIPSGVDHVVITCGASTFGPLASFDSTDKWAAGINGKLMAVTNLVLMLIHQQVKILRDGGSITITTGMAAVTLNKMWPGIACNNAGLNAFVVNGGIDLPRGLRLNAVSPALVTETAKAAGLPTSGTVAADTVGAAYVPFVTGKETGVVKTVGTQKVFKKTHDKAHDATGGAEVEEEQAATEGPLLKKGKTYKDEASQFEVKQIPGVRGLLAYDVSEPLTNEEYDKWLYDIHYHDLLANPFLDKMVLNTVSTKHFPILSSGKKVEGMTFYRLAELHFKDYDSYYKYVDWFKANPIPLPRTPAGKSAFKFYVMGEAEEITRL